MKKKNVKYLFIAFFIYLPVQYGIVGIVGYFHSEPWPAFVFPGFKSVHVFDDGFELNNTYFDIYQNNDMAPVRLKPMELFPDIPKSQISGFMRTHFSDIDQFQLLSSEGREWLSKKAEQAVHSKTEQIGVAKVREYYSKSGAGSIQDSVVVLSYHVIELDGEAE